MLDEALAVDSIGDNPLTQVCGATVFMCDPSTRSNLQTSAYPRPCRPFSNPVILRGLPTCAIKDNFLHTRPASAPHNCLSVSAVSRIQPTILDISDACQSGVTTCNRSPDAYIEREQEKSDYDTRSTGRSIDSPSKIVQCSVPFANEFCVAFDTTLPTSAASLVECSMHAIASLSTSPVSIDSAIPPECTSLSDFSQLTSRPKLKRPHSVIAADNRPSVLVNALKRPFSAPKRLSEELCDSVPQLFKDRNAKSPTPVNVSAILSAEPGELDDPEPPKSTLEALVASESPLLFFPTGFSIDTERDSASLCAFLTTSPEKSRSSPLDGYDAADVTYSLDLESNRTDFLPADSVGSDPLNVSSANSVNSSKSLASVDLADSTMKGTDSHVDSPKSNISELGAAGCETEAIGSNSITTHLSAFVEAMRSYAAELCPVDCVIMIERCRPFNCDTLFMKYFREQYLCPILSNLNGGPPLNADFGRDAYTSLYSLHGFYWKKPYPTTTWVADTPIIYRILKRISTLQHEERHATDRSDMCSGTPGLQLIEAAIHAFDTIDRARRGLCKQVQRHLLLLAVSPLNLTSILHTDTSQVIDGSLADLRRRGVALSVFSPIRSSSLLKLYELVNGAPPSVFYDRRWQTVFLSAQLLSSDSPERRVVGPLAADFHAQAEAELLVIEQQHHMLQQQQQRRERSQAERTLPNGHPSSGDITSISPISPAPYAGRLTRGSSQNGGFSGTLIDSCQSTTSPIAGSVGITMEENCYLTTSGKPATLSSMSYSALSPIIHPYQGLSTDSPVSHPHRPGNRGTGHSSTPPAYVSRPVPARLATEMSRSIEQPVHHSIVSCNPLSAGHSGPNSIDQLGPGSAYGSDSVATPLSSSMNIMSPQQVCNNTPMTTQLHSPATNAITPNLLGVVTTQHHPGSYVPYASYQHQQPVFDAQSSQATLRPTPGLPPSPNTAAPTFRQLTNAPSPGGSQFLNYAPTAAGLPSPSSSRSTTRQYSPQVTVPSQVSHHQRHTSPHPTAPLPSNQPTHLHHLSSDNFVGSNLRPRSITPTNHPTTCSGNSNVQSSSPYSSTAVNPAWVTCGQQSVCTMGPAPCTAFDSQSYRPSTADYCPSNQSFVATRQSTTGFVGMGINGAAPHRDLSSEESVHRRGEFVSRPISGPAQPIRRQHSSLEPFGRNVIWEGEVKILDANATCTPARLNMRLILEQTGAREMSQLNMQLWGSTAQLSVILAHRDSVLVHQLTSCVPGGYLLARVLVDLPQSEEGCALVSALSASINSAALPLGILSPPANQLLNVLPPGAIGFVCLSYSSKRNRIYGLIPSDSELFRHDLSPRNYGKPVNSCLPLETSGATIMPRPVSSISSAGSRAPLPSQEEQCASRSNPSGHLPQHVLMTHNQGSSHVAVQKATSTTAFKAHPTTSMIAQRSTPSPHPSRDLLCSQSISDPQPPPQWMASQMDPTIHAQASNAVHSAQLSHQSRGIKSNHPQPPMNQFPQRTVALQLHTNTGQSYSFQQHRNLGDRFASHGVVAPNDSIPVSAPHSVLLNEPSIGVDQPLQQDSPQSGHQRFVHGGNNIFQTGSNSSNSQASYSLSGSGCSQLSNYEMASSQTYVQRGSYLAQPAPQHMSSLTTTGSGFLNSVSGCFSSRTDTASSGYRFIPDSPTTNASFVQVQPHAVGGIVTKHPVQSQSYPVMETSGFQVIPARQLNSSMMPVDGRVVVATPQLSVMGSSGSNSGSSHFVQSTQEFAQQQHQHMVAGTLVYGPVRLPHSTYDMCGSSAGPPPGFF